MTAARTSFTSRILTTLIVFAAASLTVAQTPFSTTATLSVSGTSPVSLQCGINGPGSRGGFGSPGLVTFTDLTANQILGTASTITQSTSSVSGNFNSATIFPTPNPTSTVLTGDFNGDGIPDLASINLSLGGTSVSVLIGIGDGTFQGPITSTGGAASQGYYAVDVNGDGKSDLVGVGYPGSIGVAGSLVVMLSNGDGTFQSPVTYPLDTTVTVAESVGGVTFADFNRDGNIDVAILPLNATPPGSNGIYTILFGSGGGSFSAPTIGPLDFSLTNTAQSIPGIVSGDFNLDGSPDLVVAGKGQFSVLLGNGDGTFQSPVDYFPKGGVLSILAGDFNNDGAPDLAVTTWATPLLVDTVAIYFNNRLGSFTASNSEILTSGYVQGLALTGPFAVEGDFRGASPNLIVINPNNGQYEIIYGIVKSASNNSVAYVPSSLTLRPFASQVAFADFNGDGFTDAAYLDITSGGISVQLNAATTAASASLNNINLPSSSSLTHSLQCSYAGNSTYAASTSASVPVTTQGATASPSILPGSGTYSSAQTVTLTDVTPGAAIYYSIDGSIPTASSNLYAGPISINASTVINAIALASGYTLSAPATASIVINLPAAAPPVFSVATGTYTSTQTVAITDTTVPSTIYYAINGTPTINSTVYAGAITVSATETLEAIAIATNYSQSAVATAAYTIMGSQTITFGAAPSVTVNGTGTLSATATSGLAVTFTSTTPLICTVSGSTVTGVAAGSCMVAANQAGNTTYAAAPQVTQTITISPASQTITFGAAPSVTVNGTGALSATATSGLAVTFTSSTPLICTVSGSTVTGVAAGSCLVAANQAGNTNYAAAPQVTQTITVGPASQTITFGAAPSVTVNGTGALSATATSGLAVTFTSSTPLTCTVSGSTVTGVAAGSCMVAANQPGNTTYAAAPQVTQTITVGKGSQTITFGAAPSVTVNGTGTLSATASSGLAVTFTSTTATICTVSGSTVTGVKAGTCTVAANQAGNTNYNAATQVTQNITVTTVKTNQTITFGTAPTVKVGATGTVSATATSGLAVTFTSSTPLICTVSGSTVTGVAAGACTIAGNQSGNTTYNAAPPVTQNITVGKGSQTITFGAAPAVTVNGTGTVSATASSGLAVTFTSTTGTICTVSGSTVTGVKTGTCTIAANQAGNTNYNAATQVTQNITVTAAKKSQTITFGAAPTVKVGATGTVSATASSGLAVTFTSTTPTICKISGSTVTGVAAGTCTIAGNQSGNTTYNAAPQVTQNITVGKGSQTITFGAAPSVTVGGTGTVSATATSGLTVTFTSTTGTICKVSGSTVTGVKTGTCTIAANQAGNTNYNAASQVTQNITVK